MERSVASDGATEDEQTSAGTRLVIVDNRLLFAHSLAAAISGQPGIVVIGVGPLGDAAGFLATYDDCVILMSASDGLSAILQGLSDTWVPRRIVVLANSNDRVLMEQVLATGVRGIVDESATLGALVHALRTVDHGQTSIPAHVLDGVVNRRLPARLRDDSKAFADYALTPREIDVLGRLNAGQGTRRMAEELFLSVSTVRSHIQSVITKLDVHSRLEAVARARDLGLLASHTHAG